jgi:hypothetical protein
LPSWMKSFCFRVSQYLRDRDSRTGRMKVAYTYPRRRN